MDRNFESTFLITLNRLLISQCEPPFEPKEDELKKIEQGLDLVLVEWREGRFQVDAADEDIHSANERRLKVYNRPINELLTVALNLVIRD